MDEDLELLKQDLKHNNCIVNRDVKSVASYSNVLIGPLDLWSWREI